MIRSCYASWMRVPEGSIRVRWYKIANVPGTYDLPDYSSSNYDPDNRDSDPPLGEESTTRSPFADWRDCSPPPWPNQAATDCPTAVSPTLRAYTVKVKLTVLLPPGFVLAGTYTLTLGDDCLWSVTVPLGTSGTATFTLLFGTSGQAILGLVLILGGLITDAATWESAGPVDATQPIPVVEFASDPTAISGVGPLTLKPVEPATLETRAGYSLGTETGNFILVTP